MAEQRYLKIHLVRHGESVANTGEHNPQEQGDHSVHLTERGILQSEKAGKKLGREIIENSLIYCSPYRRTIETLDGMLKGVDVKRDDVRIYQDPRLREMDFGYGNVNEQREKRPVHGWFFYRFEGGESPADCYDRTSSFLESMMREIERKDLNNLIIVTHGVTIRCFVMRFMHLTVDDYDLMKNPLNTDIVTIEPRLDDLHKNDICNKEWTARGLRWY